jgi:carboxylesterase
VSQIFYTGPEHRPFTFEAGPERALLIHGFLGSPRDLRPLAQELATVGITAHGPLLPGFGEDIGRLRTVRAEEWLNAAREAWRATREGASRTILIGYSMGGALALRLAAEAGLAPDQLILLAPHWKFADRRAVILPLAKHVIRDIRPFGRIDFDNQDIRRMFIDIAPGLDLEDLAVRRELRQAAAIPTPALDQLRRVGAQAMTVAPTISAPTTIVQGLQDTATLPKYTRILAARMGAALHELTGNHAIVDPGMPWWTTVRDLILSVATTRQGA